MKIGSIVVVVWLVIGALAALQRGYFSDDSKTTAGSRARPAASSAMAGVASSAYAATFCGSRTPRKKLIQ